MDTNLWFWISFNAGVLCMLAIDLFGFQRRAHAPSTKEAAIWTAVWVALSLGFNALIWYWEGHAKALEFLTGYLVEYSLSVDNIFVFVLIFSYFSVPAAYQHRVLFWGILSALIFRGIMIGVGVAFVEAFHWALYVLGVFLLFTGIKMFFSSRKAVDIAGNPLIRLVRRLLPVSATYHGARFTVLRDGRRLLTPLTLVLIMIEVTDVLFAVDSIPAIFGITRDPFIVYTSNVFAILGLRSLFFLLAGVVHKFVYLKSALAIILSFIGAKMLLADVYHIPTAASLGIVGMVLLAAIGLSLLVNRQHPATPARTTETDLHSEPVIQSPMMTNDSTSKLQLSRDLELLKARAKGKSLTLAELKQALKGRGSAMLLILLALPFCFIAIPGLSTPFGIAISLIGACLALGREPWLPAFVLRRRLSTTHLTQLLTGAIKVARQLEKFVRPRLSFLHGGSGMLRLIGLSIVIAGLGLMLPLPIPFSNSIPALAVVLLAIGMMEKDGLCVLLGHLTAIAAWAVIGLTSAFAVGGFQRLLDFFPAL